MQNHLKWNRLSGNWFIWNCWFSGIHNIVPVINTAFSRGSRQEYNSTEPSFTMRRKMEHLREELEQIGLLRQVRTPPPPPSWVTIFFGGQCFYAHITAHVHHSQCSVNLSGSNTQSKWKYVPLSALRAAKNEQNCSPVWNSNTKLS